MNDLISRQEALDALFELYEYQRDIDPTEAADLVRQGVYLSEKKIEHLPSAQPTLYGYQIEHLALIARVMAKEGVTPEKAVETFGDISRIVQMIVEEQREIIRKAVDEWGTL